MAGFCLGGGTDKKRPYTIMYHKTSHDAEAGTTGHQYLMVPLIKECLHLTLVTRVPPICSKMCHYVIDMNIKVPLNSDQLDAEEIQKQEQEKIDTAEPLSEEQLEERERLLQEVHLQWVLYCDIIVSNETYCFCIKGFTNWSKRDFNQFVKACAEYGRDDLDAISKEIDGKTPEEVNI